MKNDIKEYEKKMIKLSVKIFGLNEIIIFICNFKRSESMSGRRSDAVWNNFKKVTVDGKSGCRAVCNKCNKEMQGLVERMKKHLLECNQSKYLYE
jgi:hypothetical protein